MARSPQTYGEALAERTAALNAARLADPGEHFPYKHDAALAAGTGDPVKVWSWSPQRGLAPTDVAAATVLPASVADATAAYVAAQEAYLRDPGDATKGEYDRTRDALVATRQTERAGRTNHGIAADEVTF